MGEGRRLRACDTLIIGCSRGGEGISNEEEKERYDMTRRVGTRLLRDFGGDRDNMKIKGGCQACSHL